MKASLLLFIVWLGISFSLFAQTKTEPSPAENEHQAIAVEIQNPFATVYVLPLQSNLGLGYGSNEGVQSITNFQPTIPFHISEKWKLITHPIIPIGYTSWPENAGGLGDINIDAAVSMVSKKNWVLGFGLIAGFPTATTQAFGTGKWTIGPLAGAFHQLGKWTFSLLYTQQFSYAGDASRSSVNIMQLQPNINYNFSDGLYLFSNPQITASFTAPQGQQWIVPMGAGIGKVFSVSKQKMSASLEGYSNVVRPEVGPTALLVFTFQLLFPRQVW